MSKALQIKSKNNPPGIWWIHFLYLYLPYNKQQMEDEIDLFEDIESLPQEVQDVITKYEEMDNTYENCRALVADLKVVGYTCDYGLDAIPYELKKL